MMTAPNLALRSEILQARRQGARGNCLWPLALQSLRTTPNQPTELRRAKAQAHILDHAPLALCEGELLLGSALAFFPIDPKAPDIAQLQRGAERVAQSLLQSGAAPDAPRHGLTQRDHGDSRIHFYDLQHLSRKLSLEYIGVKPGALPHALARALQVEYGEAKLAVKSLPWRCANQFAPDFELLLDHGFSELDARIRRQEKSADDPLKKQFFAAQRIVLSAAQRFVLRYANAASGRANRTEGETAQQLSRMAAMLRKIATGRIEHFHEALQLILMILLMAQMLGNDGASLGRLDLLLGQLYAHDFDEGLIDAKVAHELLCCLFIKLNEPGRSACALTLGGAIDEKNAGAHALTFICLNALADVNMPQPDTCVRIHSETPDALIQALSDGIRQDFCPVIMNDDIWTDRLIAGGCTFTQTEGYAMMPDGCLTVPGQSPGHVITSALCLPRVTAKLAAAPIETLLEQCRMEISRIASDIWLSAHERAIDRQMNAYDPFASLVLRDCIERGRDALQGGATLRCDWIVPVVGLASAADALLMLEQDQNVDVSPAQSFGNGSMRADELANSLLQMATEAISALSVDGMRCTLKPALLDGYLHAAMGERAEATIDGRKRANPFSTGAQPQPGRDQSGLSALLRSTKSLSAQLLSGGFALSIPLNESSIEDQPLQNLIRDVSWLPAVRFHKQNTAKLLAARDDRDCDIIATTGSLRDYFIELDALLQDDIIKRTVHPL